MNVDMAAIKGNNASDMGRKEARSIKAATSGNE